MQTETYVHMDTHARKQAHSQTHTRAKTLSHTHRHTRKKNTHTKHILRRIRTQAHTYTTANTEERPQAHERAHTHAPPPLMIRMGHTESHGRFNPLFPPPPFYPTTLPPPQPPLLFPSHPLLLPSYPPPLFSRLPLFPTFILLFCPPHFLLSSLSVSLFYPLIHLSGVRFYPCISHCLPQTLVTREWLVRSLRAVGGTPLPSPCVVVAPSSHASGACG